jgi:hypothetical protein
LLVDGHNALLHLPSRVSRSDRRPAGRPTASAADPWGSTPLFAAGPSGAPAQLAARSRTAAGLVYRQDGDLNVWISLRERIAARATPRVAAPAVVGERTGLPRPTFAMTEQPRTISITRINRRAGTAGSETVRQVGRWVKDFVDIGR